MLIKKTYQKASLSLKTDAQESNIDSILLFIKSTLNTVTKSVSSVTEPKLVEPIGGFVTKLIVRLVPIGKSSDTAVLKSSVVIIIDHNFAISQSTRSIY